jgi:hypothetical protein
VISLRRALLVAAALLATACIERPPRDGQPGAAPQARQQIDRASLHGILVQQLPPDLVPVSAVFGNAIELVGYRLEPAALVPGQAARVTFFWRCRAELNEPWHVFVHLDDATGSGMRINGDHDPATGRFPTDAWRVGDVIADPIVFGVDRFPLMLFVGFYSAGESRLPLSTPGRGRSDGHDRLLAGILPLARQ